MIKLEKDIQKTINSRGEMYSSVGNILSSSKTYISLKHEDEYLKIFFTCENNYLTKENNYKRDNDTLYKQEVFEIFIANGYDDPIDYLELEINPSNALFVGRIHNPSGVGGESKTLVMLDSYLSMIPHEVKVSDDSWSGEISIPLSLIDDVSLLRRSNSYRFNFYRIRLREKSLFVDWECNSDNSDFLCFKSTLSFRQPNFHTVCTMARLLFL
ncbi:MAG: carbohydrate-binding family 9-like protein [Marinifilaceae bacterium]